MCTLLSGIVLLLYFVLKTGDFMLMVDPLVTMSTVVQRSDDRIDLYKHGYRFAIKNLDPRYGRISAYQGFKDESGSRQTEEIKLVNCDELEAKGLTDSIFNNKYNFNKDHSKFKTEDYLCPVDHALNVVGNFHQNAFEYVKISVIGCDESVVPDCAPPTLEAFQDVRVEFVQNHGMV